MSVATMPPSQSSNTTNFSSNSGFTTNNGDHTNNSNNNSNNGNNNNNNIGGTSNHYHSTSGVNGATALASSAISSNGSSNTGIPTIDWNTKSSITGISKQDYIFMMYKYCPEGQKRRNICYLVREGIIKCHKKNCKDGEKCNRAHTGIEIKYHPFMYKNKDCNLKEHQGRKLTPLQLLKCGLIHPEDMEVTLEMRKKAWELANDELFMKQKDQDTDSGAVVYVEDKGFPDHLNALESAALSKISAHRNSIRGNHHFHHQNANAASSYQSNNGNANNVSYDSGCNKTCSSDRNGNQSSSSSPLHTPRSVKSAPGTLSDSSSSSPLETSSDGYETLSHESSPTKLDYSFCSPIVPIGPSNSINGAEKRISIQQFCESLYGNGNTKLAIEFFKDLGVENVDDLSYINAEDWKYCKLRVIPKRKLQEKIKQLSSQSQKSTQSSTYNLFDNFSPTRSLFGLWGNDTLRV